MSLSRRTPSVIFLTTRLVKHTTPVHSACFMRLGAAPIYVRSKVTDMRLLVCISCMVICGCDSRPAVVGEPVYLYESASACHASAHAGPHDSIRGRSLRGVVATLEKGAEFAVVAED